MPEIPYNKIKPTTSTASRRLSKIPYAELQVTSNFSFLKGASHPEELVSQAAELGYHGIAITDHNSLAGVVRAHQAAKAAEIPFRVGCRLEIDTGVPILVYPTDRKAYGNLCRLLTNGKLRASKGECFLSLDDFLQYHAGLIVVLVAPFLCADNRAIQAASQGKSERAILNEQAMLFHATAKSLRDKLSDPSALYIALTRSYVALNQLELHITRQTAENLSLPVVATNDVYYHASERKPLHDVVTCIRNRCTIEQAGYLLQQNAERHLKTPEEIARIFRETPYALANSIEILNRTAGFSLDQLRYEYPNEITPVGITPLEYLKTLTWQGAHTRYPEGIPEKIQKLLIDEFALIAELAYEKYFLTCYDIVQFARAQGILCQGRGAAANSAVCYCLGITAVNPMQIDLLFARFVSKERDEPPDIDIDFEHERREEVIQHIYRRFGRERAGLTCAVSTYRYRSAIREVGKALGLSLETVDKLAKIIHRWTQCRVERTELMELGLNPDDPTITRTIALSNELLGFPRHLTQHVGGFVISEKALCETVPILNTAMDGRTMIEWDKDDIDALGMLKIDILALGMLTCIKKALAMINHARVATKEPTVELHSIPPEDPAVYKMIQAADTIGVFQIESRAQMSMLPRLRPNCFYDLVIEVAIVRPGPIQGNMVHPYLRRRNGLEPVIFPDNRVAEVLGKTMGVPLFQEQAMRLAIILANFTPGEAEQLRRAMAAWKRDKGKIGTFQARILKGMQENGYSEEFARSCIDQIKGFSEYGFPESHAASFALLVYASAWIKHYYPAQFAASLMNSQPMGFYAPSQLVSDARDHGVHVLPIDIHASKWDCVIEGKNRALRLGMRLVKGLQEAQARLVTTIIEDLNEVYSINHLWSYADQKQLPLQRRTLELLARVDAFRSLRLSSRDALWEIQSLPLAVAPMDSYENLSARTKVTLPIRSQQEEMFTDYKATGLSLRAHPLQFARELLTSRGAVPTAWLRDKDRCKVGDTVGIAGIAIVRQRPGTAKGVVFITLEDETGITNLILRPHIFDQFRNIVLMNTAMLAWGKLERVDQVIYVAVERLENLDPLVMTVRREGLPSTSYSY